MQGSFSSEAVELYAQLIGSKHNQNFSEGESYDFTRCVRPDGTSFGTDGKCSPPNRPALAPVTPNPKADALERKAEELMSGGRRNSRKMQAVAKRLREQAKKLRASA